MSITLELSPEIEARLRADAQARGVAPEALALEKLSSHYSTPLSPDERRSLVRRLQGSARGSGPTVDEFLAERSGEGRKDAHL